MSFEEKKRLLAEEIFRESDPAVIDELEHLLHSKKKESLSEKGESLMDLFGVWSEEEADEFAKSIEEMFEKVNPDEWK